MSIEISTNLDSAASIAGTYKGIVDAIESEKFLSMLVMRAHEKALDAFNQRAAIQAARRKSLNGFLKHMYEYGVPGINPGQSTISDPTSQAARLWTYNTVRSGSGVYTNVNYRKAKVPNPKPDEWHIFKSVSAEDKKKFVKTNRRDYIFYNRAEISEEGEFVSIAPMNGKALIMPIKDDPYYPEGFRFERGVVSVQPGARARTSYGAIGSFTKLWNSWWETEGDNIITQHTHQSIAGKIGAVQRRIKSTSPKPLAASRPLREYKEAAKIAKQEMMKADDTIS